jgi:hypothetical protein
MSVTRWNEPDKEGLMRKLCGAIATLLVFCVAAFGQAGLRQVPLGFCSMSSMSSATAITTTSCVFASFTASITGNVMTVTVLSSGYILPGQLVTGGAANTAVTGQTGGTPGGIGTYTVNIAQTVASGSLTTAGVPLTATYAVVCAYTQGLVWRDDGVAPTGTAGTGGQGIAANNCIPYNGTFTALQLIQQTSGAVAGVTFYR